MASRPALLITAATVIAVVSALLPATASRGAARYKVGDDSGWNLGVDYGAWASSRDFQWSDQIEFVYSNSSHNVVVVDESSYEACTVPSEAVTLTSGDDYVMLGGDKKQFFICGIEGHCQSGMKLALNGSQAAQEHWIDYLSPAPKS